MLVELVRTNKLEDIREEQFIVVQAEVAMFDVSNTDHGTMAHEIP